MRWVGYILASILILSVVVGVGFFMTIIVTVIGGALAVVGVIVFLALLIQEAVKETSNRRDS